jgi:phage terminase small subunit
MKMGDKAAKKQRPSRGAPRRSSATDIPPNIVEINDRIDVARENLRALVEQAAAYSGAANEDLISQRIAEHEALIARLIKERDEVSQTAGT